MIEKTSERELKELYDNLIRYSIFLIDVRGKSQRGAVVPRLYLRRLLIPTFKLTPSTRDSIRVEPNEFKTLLSDPDKFEKDMIKKASAGKRKVDTDVKKLDEFKQFRKR